VKNIAPVTANLYKIDPSFGLIFKIDNSKTSDAKPTVNKTKTINFQIKGF